MNTRIIRFLFSTTIGLAIALLLLVLQKPAVTYALPPGRDINVNTTDDVFNGASCSLRDAIHSANMGGNFGGCVRIPNSSTAYDRILLPSGTYTLTIPGSGEDLDMTGDLDIGASMIISATGATSPTVLGGASWTDRIFHVITGTETVTFKGLIIRGGHAGAADGGGVRIESGTSLTFNDGAVADSQGTYGGGIYNNGTLTLNNSIVHGNSAVTGGGINNKQGTLTLNNSTVSSNSSTDPLDGGGGIYNGGDIYTGFGTMTLTNVTLISNTAGNGGASTAMASRL